MANNKISLVDKNTGEWVTLARFFPSSGWTISINEDNLKRMLHVASKDSEYSALGEYPFELKYDVDDNKN